MLLQPRRQLNQKKRENWQGEVNHSKNATGTERKQKELGDKLLKGVLKPVWRTLKRPKTKNEGSKPVDCCNDG